MTTARALTLSFWALALVGCSDYQLEHTQLGAMPAGDTAAEPWLTQEWTQGLADDEPVDVLWLTDHSCSMDVNESGATADALRATIADMHGADWRVWLGSTDPADTPIGPLTRETSAAAIDLTIAMQMGHREEGLGSSFKHIEYGGMLREQAHLVTVMVSDEDDGSGSDPAAWADWYSSVRADGWTASAIAVAGVGGCGDAPVRYEAAGAAVLDLCEPEWVDGIAGLTAWAEGRKTWTLDAEPLDGTLGVWVEGEAVTWTLDGRDLTLDEAPRPSERIVARYLAE